MLSLLYLSRCGKETIMAYRSVWHINFSAEKTITNYPDIEPIHLGPMNICEQKFPIILILGILQMTPSR